MKPFPSPYAQALLDFWRGSAGAAYTVHRADGFSQLVPAAASFGGAPFPPLEQLALDRCVGRVLDVGAGAGRHTLWLQEHGLPVTTIDTVPELAAILSERGAREVLTGSLFDLTGREFDTILLLMNGFGLVGTPQGARTFFQHVRQLLAAGGQILCDSVDVRRTTNPVHLAYQQGNLARGLPMGQMQFQIEYGGRRGEPFDWFHASFSELSGLANQQGWSAEMLSGEVGGHYLARLIPGDGVAA